jgi:hypothetical protein
MSTEWGHDSHFQGQWVGAMDELLRELLNALDIIGQEHEEIYDSECREQMGNPIFNLFIKPNENYECPDYFALYSQKANQQVEIALTNYIHNASQLAYELGLNTFHQRLAAFQDNDVRSDLEKNYFDDFFGWSNPELFDQAGNVV